MRQRRGAVFSNAGDIDCCSYLALRYPWLPDLPTLLVGSRREGARERSTIVSVDGKLDLSNRGVRTAASAGLLAERQMFSRRVWSYFAILATRTRQKVPDCTIYQHRMGLHRAVSRVLNPNHDCIRCIVVDVIQLTRQAVRVLHSPKNQRWNIHPERSGGGRFRDIGKEYGGKVRHFHLRCIRDRRRHLNGICAVVVVPGRIRGNSSVVIALVLRCLNLRRAIANLTEKYCWVRCIENDQALNVAWIGRSKHPSNVATPVIAHQNAPLTAEVPQQGMHIAQRSWHRIGLDCFGLI